VGTTISSREFGPLLGNSRDVPWPKRNLPSQRIVNLPFVHFYRPGTISKFEHQLPPTSLIRHQHIDDSRQYTLSQLRMMTDNTMNNIPASKPTQASEGQTVVAVQPPSAETTHATTLNPSSDSLGPNNTSTVPNNLAPPPTMPADGSSTNPASHTPLVFHNKMKLDQQEAWISQVSVDDVTLTVPPNVTKISKDATTKLATIGGVSVTKIQVKALYKFCVRLGMENREFKDKSKATICNLIVHKIDSNKVYAESSGRNEPLSESAAVAVTTMATTTEAAASSVIAVMPQNRKPRNTNKGGHLVKVTKEGTYYRAMNVWFCEHHREDVLTLGQKATRAQLDSRKWINQTIFEKLIKTYNNKDPETNHGIDNLMVEDSETPFAKADPTDFDELHAVDFKELMDYLAHHYKEVQKKKTTSGNHDNFARYIGHKAYLLYYDLLLSDHGDLREFADANLGDAYQEAEDGVSSSARSRRSGRPAKRKSHSDALDAQFKEMQKVQSLCAV